MPPIMPHLTAYAIGLVHHQSEPNEASSSVTVLPFPLPPSRRASALSSSFIGDISRAGVRLCNLVPQRGVEGGRLLGASKKPAMTKAAEGGRGWLELRTLSEEPLAGHTVGLPGEHWGKGVLQEE